MCKSEGIPKAAILVPPFVDPELVKTWGHILGASRTNQLLGMYFFDVVDVKPASEIPLSEITDVCEVCGLPLDECECTCDECGMPLSECECEATCEDCGKPIDECECICEGCGKPKCECECEEDYDDWCDDCPEFANFLGAFEVHVINFLRNLADMLASYDAICELCECCVGTDEEDEGVATGGDGATGTGDDAGIGDGIETDGNTTDPTSEEADTAGADAE